MLDVEKIKQLRQARGLTQEQAAAKAGLGSKQRWSNIESGRETNLELSTLQRIARALGCRAKDLING